MKRKNTHPDSILSFLTRKLKNQAIKSMFLGVSIPLVFSACSIVFFPKEVNAGILSVLSSVFAAETSPGTPEKPVNSQNMPLLQASVSAGLDSMRGGGDITVVKDSLLPETGPSGSIADIEGGVRSDKISIYVVRPGDTLSGIAKMFDVSVNTIVWANDIKGGKISPDQTLVILPVTGIKYAVKKGDTLKAIVKKFKADESEVIQFNDLSQDGTLAVGDIIIIPDGEMDAPKSAYSSGTSKVVKGYSGPNYAGYYVRPLSGGRKTQGIHGYNGIDIGTPSASPVYASAPGVVIISKNYGWNGGYGQYIAIQHQNGTETLYAHLSKNIVSLGSKVDQGDIIGLSGNTGKSTGPHLHFEIRGAVNPF